MTNLASILDEEVATKVAIVFLFMESACLEQFLFEAEKEGYGNGEYVFFNIIPVGAEPYQFKKGD